MRFILRFTLALLIDRAGIFRGAYWFAWSPFFPLTEVIA